MPSRVIVFREEKKRLCAGVLGRVACGMRRLRAVVLGVRGKGRERTDGRCVVMCEKYIRSSNKGCRVGDELECIAQRGTYLHVEE